MTRTSDAGGRKTEDRKPRRRRAKGSGGYHREGREHVYVLDLPRDPATGRRRRIKYKSVDKQKALDKFNAGRRKLIANGTLPSTGSPILGDWLDRWLVEFKQPNVKPRTYETYCSDVRLIKASLGALRLDRITTDHVRKLEKDITAHRSAKTALNAYLRLSSALRDAVGEGLVDSNVCLSVEPPRVEANPTIILKPDQPRLLIEHAADRPAETRRRRGQHRDPDTDDDRRMWRLMWRLAFETGMRQGERFALTPADLVEVDGTPMIHVRHELQSLATDAVIPAWLDAEQIDGNVWMVPPKSHRGVRMVPISRTLWDDLHTWATAHDIPADKLIFTRRGHPLTNPVERRRWYRALEAAGLPRVTIRSARHWFATRLAVAGASEDARKAIMGHAEISTTAGYTHWDGSDLAKLTGTIAVSFEDGEDA